MPGAGGEGTCGRGVCRGSASAGRWFAMGLSSSMIASASSPGAAPAVCTAACTRDHGGVGAFSGGLVSTHACESQLHSVGHLRRRRRRFAAGGRVRARFSVRIVTTRLELARFERHRVPGLVCVRARARVCVCMRVCVCVCVCGYVCVVCVCGGDLTRGITHAHVLYQDSRIIVVEGIAMIRAAR